MTDDKVLPAFLIVSLILVVAFIIWMFVSAEREDRQRQERLQAAIQECSSERSSAEAYMACLFEHGVVLEMRE